jgi:hypothetical protein
VGTKRLNFEFAQTNGLFNSKGVTFGGTKWTMDGTNKKN